MEAKKCEENGVSSKDRNRNAAEDDTSSNSSSSSDSASCSDDDGSESDAVDLEGPLETSCPLCDERVSPDSFPPHLEKTHSVILSSFRLDQMGYIKFVNWLRSGSAESCLKRLQSPELSSPAPWEDDNYLKPVLEEDPLLTLWIEEDDLPDAVKLADGEGGLSSLLESAKRRNQFLAEQVEELKKQNGLMKEALLRIMKKGEGKAKAGRESSSAVEKFEGKDEDYFESYDSLDIHAEMLKDSPRTLSYKRSIQNNAGDFCQKTALDLGCGTGILSLFAADAGAKLVYAVDCSKMVYDAMDICYENDKGKQIKFITRKLETVKEDELEKVDIIISEFMGYFLLFEGMTNSYLFARDKYLKPGGKLFPNKADMFLVALSDNVGYKDSVEIWSDVHGYKMSALRKKVLDEACVQLVSGDVIASKEVNIKSLDLHSCSVTDLLIDGEFELEITKTCTLTAMCGYFSVNFDDGSVYQEVLNTSPASPPTHWKQTVFYLPEKITAFAGDKIPIKFTCKPHPEFERWLKIDLKIRNLACSYEMK